jgi:hypothetical protein
MSLGEIKHGLNPGTNTAGCFWLQDTQDDRYVNLAQSDLQWVVKLADHCAAWIAERQPGRFDSTRASEH